MSTRKPKTSPERKEDATTMEPTVAEIGKPDLAATVARPLTPLPDTKETRLYNIASKGAPLTSDFFKEFPDMQEIVTVGLSICVRLALIAVCNGELAPTQRIAAMRIFMSLSGKQVPEEEDDKFKQPAPLVIPRGSKEEVNATLEKIRQLSSDSLS
jgi:hypothetical protein